MFVDFNQFNFCEWSIENSLTTNFCKFFPGQDRSSDFPQSDSATRIVRPHDQPVRESGTEHVRADGPCPPGILFDQRGQDQVGLSRHFLLGCGRVVALGHHCLVVLWQEPAEDAGYDGRAKRPLQVVGGGIKWVISTLIRGYLIRGNPIHKYVISPSELPRVLFVSTQLAPPRDDTQVGHWSGSALHSRATLYYDVLCDNWPHDPLPQRVPRLQSAVHWIGETHSLIDRLAGSRSV